MKCVYGNDWNPNLLFNGMKLGMFQSNVHYSSQANYKDYFNMFSERTENGISIPYYEVTLHKVSKGNMRTKKLTNLTFLKNKYGRFFKQHDNPFIGDISLYFQSRYYFKKDIMERKIRA